MTWNWILLLCASLVLHLVVCKSCLTKYAECTLHCHAGYIRSWTRYWTLPSQIQSVIVCIRHMQHFDDVAMRWWLDVILSNCAVVCCNVECGRVTKLQWIQLCNFMYELVQEQGELRVPLHFFVEGFRVHRQAPCRSPHELPLVADSSHLLFHMSSQITVSTPTVLISSQWVLDQLGVARE